MLEADSTTSIERAWLTYIFLYASFVKPFISLHKPLLAWKTMTSLLSDSSVSMKSEGCSWLTVSEAFPICSRLRVTLNRKFRRDFRERGDEDGGFKGFVQRIDSDSAVL